MKEIIICCSKIIAKSGEAKSMFMEAIKESRNFCFKNAEELMSKGNASLLEGHRVHAQLIQKEASDNNVEVSLLLIHAEDQMNSAEVIQSMAEEFLFLYKERLEKEDSK